MQSGTGIRYLQQRVKELCKSLLQRSFNGRKTEGRVKNRFGSYPIVELGMVSEMRNVPSYIPKPSYSDGSVPVMGPDIPDIKTENEIECMRASCNFAKRVLQNIRPDIKPGVTTDEIDAIIHEMIISNGAYPSPLNYRGFPKSICTSVNNVVCHGVPDSRPLVNGDILNVDVTVYLNGYHGDCSQMFEAGECDDEAKKLINVTQLCLDSAIAICKPNERFSTIGNTIEKIARDHGLTVVPAVTGHGIGTYFHGEPSIYHFANDYPGEMLPGMTFTIEPALTQGGEQIAFLEDQHTVVTVDNARAAQIEHTILITEDGCEVLTC